MIQNTLTELAQAAGWRYSNFEMALQGAVHQTMNHRAPTAPQAKTMFHAQAINIANALIHSEKKLTEANRQEIVDQAVEQALYDLDVENFPGDKREILDQMTANARDAYIGALIAQTGRDIADAKAYLRNFALEIAMTVDSTGHSYSAAVVKAKEHRKAGMSFAFTDRAGKKWQADRYIRVLSRQFLLTVYNEAYLYVISQFGWTTASDGETRFSFAGDPGNLPRYEDVKKDLFHPNSSRVVTAR